MSPATGTGWARLPLALGACAALFTASALVAPAAGARPWTATYDWDGTPTTGSDNWNIDERLPETGQPGPWYRPWVGSGAPPTIGPGLAIRPLGGRVYDNGDRDKQTGGPGMILRWKAPGASRITRADVSALRYRNEGDGQYLRVRVATNDPSTDETVDIGPARGQDDPGTTYEPPERSLIPSAPGVSLEAWLFTVCNPDLTAPPGTDRYRCPNVAEDTGTFGRVGRAVITLDDPDVPTVDVSAQPQIDGGWVNKRRTQRLSVSAADPSSGVRRVRIQVRIGASTRTLTDRVVSCDPLHRTPGSGGLVCPPSATATATDPSRDASSQDRTYIVTVVDYAGNETVKTVVVRRDLEAPGSGNYSGELRRLTRTWSNRIGPVPVTLRGTDLESGVAKLELVAQRRAGGRSTVIAAADVDCARGCTSASREVLADLSSPGIARNGAYRLSVRVTDRAGNRESFTPDAEFKRDRTPPARTPEAPQLITRKDGSVVVRFVPGRDPSAGAGLGDVIVRYYPKSPGPADLAATRVARPFDLSAGQAAPRFYAQSIEGLPMARASTETGADGRRYRAASGRTLMLRDPEGIDVARGIVVGRTDKASNGAPDLPAGRLSDERVQTPTPAGPVTEAPFEFSPANVRIATAKCKPPGCIGEFPALPRRFVTVRRSRNSYVIGAMKVGDKLYTGPHRASSRTQEWWGGYVQSRRKPVSYTGCGFIQVGTKNRKLDLVQSRRASGRARACAKNTPAPRDWMAMVERSPFAPSKEPCERAYPKEKGAGWRACQRRVKDLMSKKAPTPEAEDEDQEAEDRAEGEQKKEIRTMFDYVRRAHHVQHGRDSVILTKRPATVFRNAFPHGFGAPEGATSDDVGEARLLPVGTRFRWRYVTKRNPKTGQELVLGLLSGRDFQGTEEKPPLYGNQFTSGLGWVFLDVDAFREPGTDRRDVPTEQAICGSAADRRHRRAETRTKMPEAVCRRYALDWTAEQLPEKNR